MPWKECSEECTPDAHDRFANCVIVSSNGEAKEEKGETKAKDDANNGERQTSQKTSFAPPMAAMPCWRTLGART